MRTEVRLTSEYYPWKEIEFNGNRYWLKGDVFLSNTLLSPEKLVALIHPLISRENKDQEKGIKNFLEELNGEFAIVAENENKIFCAVDKVRSIPLFYSNTKTNFILSNSAYYLKDKTVCGKVCNQEFNEKNAAEFMLAGYVTGNETLFNCIKQVRNAEFLIYRKKENELKTFCYFRFLHGNYYDLAENELFELLDRIFVKAFSRLIESTEKQGKRLVVPLSGGLDSRIIVSMLKRLGIKNVICVSYGRKGSREAIISKQIAKALGYEWLFIEYTNKKWYECYHSKEADSFRKYAGNLSSLPHMQDFLAIKGLKIQKRIPENSVFVPGHTGDMLSGSHIPVYYLDSSRHYDSATFLKDSLKKHYNLWRLPSNCELETAFKEKMLKILDGFEIKDNSSCASAVEFFDFNERQAKYIVNSVRAYEFFGYEWRIPLWDTELINFFLRVPIEQRIDRVLYRKYARDWLFAGELSELKNIDCTTDILDFRPLEKRSKYEKLLYYKKFIHSYYDEKVNNPIWGRYFKNPIMSRLLTKITRYENDDIERYPLLRMILEHRNNKKYNLTINGISSLEYLTDIIRENYSFRSKIILKPASAPTKKSLELVNMRIGKR